MGLGTSIVAASAAMTRARLIARVFAVRHLPVVHVPAVGGVGEHRVDELSTEPYFLQIPLTSFARRVPATTIEFEG